MNPVESHYWVPHEHLQLAVVVLFHITPTDLQVVPPFTVPIPTAIVAGLLKLPPQAVATLRRIVLASC